MRNARVPAAVALVLAAFVVLHRQNRDYRTPAASTALPPVTSSTIDLFDPDFGGDADVDFDPEFDPDPVNGTDVDVGGGGEGGGEGDGEADGAAGGDPHVIPMLDNPERQSYVMPPCEGPLRYLDTHPRAPSHPDRVVINMACWVFPFELVARATMAQRRTNSVPENLRAQLRDPSQCLRNGYRAADTSFGKYLVIVIGGGEPLVIDLDTLRVVRAPEGRTLGEAAAAFALEPDPSDAFENFAQPRPNVVLGPITLDTHGHIYYPGPAGVVCPGRPGEDYLRVINISTRTRGVVEIIARYRGDEGHRNEVQIRMQRGAAQRSAGALVRVADFASANALNDTRALEPDGRGASLPTLAQFRRILFGSLSRAARRGQLDYSRMRRSLCQRRGGC